MPSRDAGVLFTGDIAAESQGAVILGPFNVDRAQAADSFRRLGERAGDVDTLYFGHGRPLQGPESAAFANAARAEVVPDPFG